eukprot:GHVU01018365.1.p2 GENE.GHVU01018365.1~~GHVU01018365.1.p2  ORF type:complete len:162 (+),score=25.19 GHVU01018365.1:440-925(+)
MLCGKGSVVRKDGSWTDGTWKEGKLHGTATNCKPDGSRMHGTWVNGQQHGAGVVIGPGGSRIEGTWIEGELEGEVDMITSDGCTLRGTWKDGAPRGPIVIEDSNTGNTLVGRVEAGRIRDSLIDDGALSNNGRMVSRHITDRPFDLNRLWELFDEVPSGTL